MTSNGWLVKDGYSGHACKHLGSWPSHEIGWTALSDDVVVLWMLRLGKWERRVQYTDYLQHFMDTGNPASVLSALNDEVCKLPELEWTAEICLMRLDPSNHLLTIDAAGDFPIFLRNIDGEIRQLERFETLPLGYMTDVASDPVLVTESLANDIQQFAGGRGPDDDICLICLRRSD